MIDWNFIKENAMEFSKEYENETSEKSEAQTFLNDFFKVFGINRRRVATFETKVHMGDNSSGAIDCLWKGRILIEMKSRGKSLERAHKQATDYFEGLKDEDLPKTIMVCDFERIHIYDLEEEKDFEFKLKDLYKNVKYFGFLIGYNKTQFEEAAPINRASAEKIAKIHDQLKDSGYTGHELEVYLVRLLFCLFADDTSIFDDNIFSEYIEETKEDGSDLASKLAELFQILDTPSDKRNNNLPETLKKFPYVNGGLFKENLKMPSFNKKMREELIDISKNDWSGISPAIFGSMFQGVIDPKKRSNIGAHYTSEKNIQKVIKPLFLDKLYEEFNSCKTNKNNLKQFHDKIANLKFLDPACGCGNFLVVTYKELRLLEIEVLKVLMGNQIAINIDMVQKVRINQFYGIEIEEFPSLVAQTAMWLVDHQMNMALSQEFGNYFLRLPLENSANIKNANALRFDWNDFIEKEKLNYIIGNPPFLGARSEDKSEEQKKDIDIVLKDIKNGKDLDYVACWYKKAVDYIKGTNIKVAYVSTNSLCQGQQVSILWKFLFEKYNIKINFAHQTFHWSNEGKNNAAVHCIIIGFSNNDEKNKKLFIYETPKSEAIEVSVKNINAYLSDYSNIIVEKRKEVMEKDAPEIKMGSTPIDNNGLLSNYSKEEKNEICLKYPELKDVFRPIIGAEEFINNKPRYCIWIENNDIIKYSNNEFIKDIIAKIKKFREESNRTNTKKASEYPYRFAEIRQPNHKYLVIPANSSSERKYIPIGFVNKNVITNNANLTIENATLYDFAILTSYMHMIWVSSIGGRIKNDYRYSAEVVYNTFPWPKPTEKQKENIERCAKEIIEVRKKIGKNYETLYKKDCIPLELAQAHDKLDKEVEKAYKRKFKNDIERLSFLLELYENTTKNS